MSRIVKLAKLDDFVERLHVLIGIHLGDFRLVLSLQGLFLRISRIHLKFSIISNARELNKVEKFNALFNLKSIILTPFLALPIFSF